MSKFKLVKGIDSTMGDDYPLNLKLLCDTAIIQQPNSKIVTRINDNTFHEITYKQFYNKCQIFASALNKIGMKPGDIVSSFMWNTARHMILYYAIPNMGLCLNPLNLRLHPKELGYILSHSQPKMVFIDADVLPAFEKIPREYLKSIKMFVICGKNMKSFGWHSTLPNAIDFEMLLGKGDMTYKWPMVDETSGCLLNYTSGMHDYKKAYIFI